MDRERLACGRIVFIWSPVLGDGSNPPSGVYLPACSYKGAKRGRKVIMPVKRVFGKDGMHPIGAFGAGDNRAGGQLIAKKAADR